MCSGCTRSFSSSTRSKTRPASCCRTATKTARTVGREPWPNEQLWPLDWQTAAAASARQVQSTSAACCSLATEMHDVLPPLPHLTPHATSHCRDARLGQSLAIGASDKTVALAFGKQAEVADGGRLLELRQHSDSFWSCLVQGLPFVKSQEMLEVNPDIDAVVDALVAGASGVRLRWSNQGVRLWFPISPSTANPALAPAGCWQPALPRPASPPPR